MHTRTAAGFARSCHSQTVLCRTNDQGQAVRSISTDRPASHNTHSEAQDSAGEGARGGHESVQKLHRKGHAKLHAGRDWGSSGFMGLPTGREAAVSAPMHRVSSAQVCGVCVCEVLVSTFLRKDQLQCAGSLLPRSGLCVCQRLIVTIFIVTIFFVTIQAPIFQRAPTYVQERLGGVCVARHPQFPSAETFL